MVGLSVPFQPETKPHTSPFWSFHSGGHELPGRSSPVFDSDCKNCMRTRPLSMSNASDESSLMEIRACRVGAPALSPRSLSNWFKRADFAKRYVQKTGISLTGELIVDASSPLRSQPFKLLVSVSNLFSETRRKRRIQQKPIPVKIRPMNFISASVIDVTSRKYPVLLIACAMLSCCHFWRHDLRRNSLRALARRDSHPKDRPTHRKGDCLEVSNCGGTYAPPFR